MKRATLFLLVLLVGLLSACGKGEEFEYEPPPGIVAPEDEWPAIFDNLFKENRCEYKNIRKLTSCYFEKGTDYRLAYGSILDENERSSFWVAKFSQSGSLLWENVITDPNHHSYARIVTYLSENKIVFANNLGGVMAWDLINVNPIILDIQEGSYKKLYVGDKYAFNKVCVYDDWFICYANDESWESTPHLKRWSVQFSNTGEILNQGEYLNIPELDDSIYSFKWLDKDYYISATTRGDIRKQHVDPLDTDENWTCADAMPANVKTAEISFDKEYVTVFYNSGSDSDNKIVKLLLENGKKVGLNFVEAELNIVIGEEYKVQVEMTGLGSANPKLIYSSSDANVATIDANGMIRGRSKGKATITVSTEDGEYNDECEVIVSHFTDAIQVSWSGSLMNVGGYTTMIGTVTLSNNSKKTIYVKSLIVTDGFGNVLRHISINDSLEDSYIYIGNISLTQVYRPAYKYIYEVDGKEYEAVLGLVIK